MKTYSLRLHDKPFNKIKSGNKTIESRLNDEKRQQFQLGDRLGFTNRNDGDKINVVITHLHHFPTFTDLYSTIPTNKFGDEPQESLIQEISQFYSDGDQLCYGVVGIEFSCD